MWNPGFRLILCLLAFWALPNAVAAQSSKQARKLYPVFQELYAMADSNAIFLDSASKMGLEILNAELDNKDKGLDTLFFGNMCFSMGHLFDLKYDYVNSAQYYLLSAGSFDLTGQWIQSGRSITKYLNAFSGLKSSRKYNPVYKKVDSLLFRQGAADSTIWLTAEAKKIRRVPGSDTFWIELDAGKAQGMIENSKFDVFTTFDTFSSINRSSIQAGTGFITKIDDFRSKGFIVLFPDFKDTLYDKDAFEVKVKADKTWVKSQFAELGAYNVRLYNYTGEAYYTFGDANLTFNTNRYDKALKLAILDDLKKAVEYYNSSNPGILDVVLESGRFKGYTYAQCMAQSSIFDLEMFFDFVISYPAKYINREFSFAEVYVTWALNNCPTGNHEMRIIDSIISMSPERLENESQYWGGYFSQIDKGDSICFDRISTMYEYESESRISSILKMQKLVSQWPKPTSDSFYSMKLVFEYYGQGEYRKMLDYADRVWPVINASDKQLIALYKGLAFSSLNMNDEALRFLDTSLALDSTYYYARGFKGWNLLKIGSVKQAIPHCLFAWQVDSAVTWTNINLAHAWVLKGDENEAHRLYRKSFEYMSVESDFYKGMIADFDYFIDKGLNEMAFSRLKKEYEQFYLLNWKHQILGDSLKQKGINLSDRKEYLQSKPLFEASVAEFLKSNKPDWSRIRNTYRWSGYTNYKLKDYKTSLAYYEKAASTTIEKELGEDNLIADYTDISNIYDWLEDTLKMAEFNSRVSGLEVSLREKRDPKKLYMIILGPEGSGQNDSFALADARAISDRLQHGADLHFDEVINHTFLGSKATQASLQMALDSAIYHLGENDVFVFYYAGFGRNTYGEGIRLSDGLMTLRDLSGYLGQIPAGRQIHIADCNGLNWREWYQRGNFGLLANSQRSLVFMGLKSARIEEPALGHSVLTHALLDAYDHTIEDGEISATEWVGTAVTGMLHKDHLYALEFQTFGHDFIIGKQKVSLGTEDTFAPQIELFGATAARGENISLVSTKGITTGRITDDSKVVFAQANGLTLTLSQNGRFELPKELIGVKNIHIMAIDEYGNKSQRDFTVTQSENTASNEGTRYAFLFASDTYEHWGDLANPIFDAGSISQLLTENYGYKSELIKNPSRRVITEKLDQIRRMKFKPNDQLFVFFAGHGLYDSVWGGYYVCPESSLPANDKYFESYYPQQTIADLLDGCLSKNVFLVMDVCFGGKMFDKHDNHQFKSVNDGNTISTEDYIKRQLQIPCRQFLTSGGNNYVEDGVPGAHSPFASRFIKALEDGATNDEYITASQIMDYLWMMRTVGNDKKSFPRYGFFGGDKDAEYVLKVTHKIRNSAIIAGL